MRSLSKVRRLPVRSATKVNQAFCRIMLVYIMVFQICQAVQWVTGYFLSMNFS